MSTAIGEGRGEGLPSPAGARGDRQEEDQCQRHHRSTRRTTPIVSPGRVTWSAEDDEFVAVCLELPSLSWLAVTPQDALAGVERVVYDTVADMQDNDEQVPVPLAERRFSGRFNVRVPEDLHRRLATEAAEQGISLNRLISERLART